MKLLAVGDIHLGRTPSRLPMELANRVHELGPAEAWRRAVDAAIAAGVKAVLLAGDVVERDDDFFEAYRELSKGVRRLTDKGVEVIGVAGNHDVKVLPRLADQIPKFQLLGSGGEWKRYEIREGGAVLTLWAGLFRKPRFTAVRSKMPAWNGARASIWACCIATGTAHEVKAPMRQ